MEMLTSQPNADGFIVGQRGTLGIMIRPYDPVNIECGRRPQTYDTSKCDALLNEIPADTGPEKTFGPPHQAGVDVPMPHEWRVAGTYKLNGTKGNIENLGLMGIYGRSTVRQMPYNICWDQFACIRPHDLLRCVACERGIGGYVRAKWRLRLVQ